MELIKTDGLWDRENLVNINKNWDTIEGSLSYVNGIVDGFSSESNAVVKEAKSVLSEAKAINQTNKDVQKQIDNIVVSSGDTNAEVAQARGTFPLLKDRIDSLENTTGVDPTIHGFATNAPWTKNRDALQKSNDYLKSIGGGVISLPKGTFEVKGVFQDSNVAFEGSETTLVHPDGESQDIISSRVYSTTGSIVKNSNRLTVSDASNIVKGTIVAIRGAGGESPLQNTTLVSSMTEYDTSINLSDVTGLHTVGSMWIDGEMIEYTGIADRTLTGVTRGVNGTTAAKHESGAKASFALRLVAGVTAVNGNILSLDKVAVKTVSNTNVLSGVVNPSIRNVMFDGNLKPDGAFLACNPVKWNLVRYGTYNINVKNAESVIYLNNAWDTDGVAFGENVTKPKGTIGSGVWMFQNCHRNRVYANFTGDTWAGVYLDNRTSKATEFDGPCDFNIGSVIVNSDYFDKNHTTTGLSIVGGNHNTFEVKTNNVHTGFSIKNGDQVYSADGTLPTTLGNHVKYNVLGAYQPHVVYATGNTVSGYHESITEGHFYDGNLKFASSFKTGEKPKLGMFDDGTYNAPSINFKNSQNTGFYLVADGQMQFVSNSDSLVRFRSTGLFFADGKNLEFNTVAGNKVGTSPTQKIGFWGATPVTQPAKIGTVATSATQTDIVNQLNQVISALRSVGIIGNT